MQLQKREMGIKVFVDPPSFVQLCDVADIFYQMPKSKERI